VIEGNGEALIAVVDGLGHGAEAAEAADRAIALVRECAERTLEEIVRACHERLRTTRGVAMTLVTVSPRLRTLSWLGVGNVEAIRVRPSFAGSPIERAMIVGRGGVVGHHLPALRSAAVDFRPGDLLLIATDGIAEGFADRTSPECDPETAVRTIMLRDGRSTDDALILVARLAETNP
jgi:negative regulator of sigma-B (phosphoserine phosphatase)